MLVQPVFFKRWLSTSLKCRPFAISKEQALQSFEDWRRAFARGKPSSPTEVTIRPILIPFYGGEKKNDVVYAGQLGTYPFSNLHVRSLFVDPNTWIPFDDQLLKIKNLSVISQWIPEDDIEAPFSIVKKAYLPGYLIQYHHWRNFQKTVLVGGETGRACGIKEPYPLDVLQEFRDMLPFKNNLFVFLPPVFLTLVMYATIRMRFSSRIVHYVSLKFSSKYHILLQNEFGESELLTQEEREQRNDDEAYQRHQTREKIRGFHSSMSSASSEIRLAKKTLGLLENQEYSQEEIRSAYRTQLLKFHPDHFKGDADEATRKTQQVIRAFRTLGEK